MQPITITATINAPRAQVWHHYTNPASIMEWNAASDDWHTPHAENDVRVGGTFLSRMEARDGSAGFDFTGMYTEVEPESRLAYAMDDGRTVVVTFTDTAAGTEVVVTFDPETEHSLELQREGWQAILDRFARFCETAS